MRGAHRPNCWMALSALHGSSSVMWQRRRWLGTRRSAWGGGEVSEWGHALDATLGHKFHRPFNGVVLTLSVSPSPSVCAPTAALQQPPRPPAPTPGVAPAR